MKNTFCNPPILSLSSWLNGCCRPQRKRAIFYSPSPSPLHPSSPVRYFLIQRGGKFLAEKRKRKRETRLCGIYNIWGRGCLLPGVTHERCCTVSLECATDMFSQFFIYEKWNIFCEKYGLFYVWVPFFVSLSSHTQNKLFRRKNNSKALSFRAPFLCLILILFVVAFCGKERERERRGKMFFLLPPPPSLLKFPHCVWCGRLCCVCACLH